MNDRAAESGTAASEALARATRLSAVSRAYSIDPRSRMVASS